MNIYYVYALLREDLTPYYIGKGSGSRINAKARVIPLPPKERRVKLVENLTEEAAYDLEVALIAKYGRIDLGTGILRNKNDGGPGGKRPVGKKAWNKGQKEDPVITKKRAAALKGQAKSQTHKSKISQAKLGSVGTFLGKHHSEESKQKIRDFNLGRKREPFSNEHKEKISQALKGTKRSAETIAKQKASYAGNKWWTNGVNNKLAKDCPAEGWYHGRTV